MAALGIIKSLSRGNRVRLNDATVTGTGSLDFTCAHASNLPGDFSATFQAVGTLGSLSADLQVSLDGTNFVTLTTGAIVAATPYKIATLIDGAIYRISITAGPTSADFWVSCN